MAPMLPSAEVAANTLSTSANNSDDRQNLITSGTMANLPGMGSGSRQRNMTGAVSEQRSCLCYIPSGGTLWECDLIDAFAARGGDELRMGAQREQAVHVSLTRILLRFL